MPKPRKKAKNTADPSRIKCPKCKAEQTAQAVNVIEPGKPAFEALMRGTLNVHTCRACGVRFHLETTLIYRDTMRQAVIVLIPADGEEERLVAEKNVDTVLREALAPEGTDAAALLAQLICRLTFTRREMIEKIALLTNGLDDRFIEFIKYHLFRNKKQDLDPVRQQLLYDFSNPEKQNIAFVVFDRESGKPTAALHVPMDTYRELAAAMLTGDDLKQEMAALFPGRAVSVDAML